MVPGIYNITIYRGGTFRIDITATDTVGLINFSTSYNRAKMYIQSAWINTGDDIPINPLYELTSANGQIMIIGNTVSLFIPATMTTALPFTSGVYNLMLILDDELLGGNPNDPIQDIILKGNITVESGATI